MIQYLQITFEIWAAVFCIVAAIVIYPARPLDRRATMSCIVLLILNCVLNLADVLAWGLRGVEHIAADHVVRITCFSIMIIAYLLPVAMARHVSMVINTRKGTVYKRLVNLTCILSALGIFAVILSGFVGDGKIYSIVRQNGIVMGPGYWILIVIAELALIPILIQVFKNRRALRKREFIVFLLLNFLPAAGGILQLLVPVLNLVSAAYSISLIFLILVHQYEYTTDVIERERVRASEQINLYTRQIQPHFIYNSLSSIRSYVPRDSKAWESLNHFAGFLRGSIDLLSAEGCIRAEREFATVTDYLYMEKDRYGEDINIVTDIRDQDFELPAFTVQTLVENAITHGIRETEDGHGTLVLKSYETKDSHCIEIEDDGAGFTTDETGETEAGTEDDHFHIGISNVKNRLELMCGGTLDIQSEPQKGCHVIICIPKKIKNG